MGRQGKKKKWYLGSIACCFEVQLTTYFLVKYIPGLSYSFEGRYIDMDRGMYLYVYNGYQSFYYYFWFVFAVGIMHLSRMHI